MQTVTRDHEERGTLAIDVLIPGHSERVTTPLFARTRKLCLELFDNRCAVSNQTAIESGAPLQVHHYFVERCMAQGVDRERLRRWIGHLDKLTSRAQAWMDAHPSDDWEIMSFVDNCLVNGMPLTHEFHTAPGSGIHCMDYPRFQPWAILKAGYDYVKGLFVIDADEAIAAVVDAGETSSTVAEVVETATASIAAAAGESVHDA